MWVAQVTEPAQQGEHHEQFQALVERFPSYQFSIMMGRKCFVICRPHPDTVKFPEDQGTESEILRFMVTELLNELITGHLITDGQEEAAPFGMPAHVSRPDQYEGPTSEAPA